MPPGRGDIHHPLAVVVALVPAPTVYPPTEAWSLWSPPSRPSMSGFVRSVTAGFSLDEHARKFLTASAPTGRPGSAPALVQQGLQPIMLKRQRLNPSRVVKNFRQGSVKDAGHSGRALVCWSTPPARTPRPKRYPALVAACWRRESVQSLSRMRPLGIRQRRAAPPSPAWAQARPDRWPRD